MIRVITVLLLIIFFIFISCENKESSLLLEGEYLGQPTPGDEPEIFKPGIISTGAFERDVTITPDGKEMYFGVAYGPFATIICTRLKDGKWSPLKVASFAKDPRYLYLEPHVTPDGQRLLFLCTRPPEEKESKPGWFYQNIWAVDRLDDGTWGKATDIGPPINTENHEYFPSVTRNGTLYFTRSVQNSGKTNIFRSQYINGTYREPELLPKEINQKGNPYNAFIDPDERFLIACVAGRDDSQSPGMADHYIFFRDQNDNWSEGMNLGEKVNEPGQNASSQYISPDGKYFFFGASKNKFIEPLNQNQLSLDLLKRIPKEPQNGSSDIYWMKSDFLSELEKRIKNTTNYPD